MSFGALPNIQGASQDVVHAIKTASQKTGVDFSYLVNQARTESSFRPDVKASTSSATGLYQFIDQTWLATVKQHGSKHGLGIEAGMIEQDFQGRYFVADPAQKETILNLRKDPATASLMAAEFAANNQQILETKLGRKATATDLYFAHFLGASGAVTFLSAMDNDAGQAAAPLMQKAAKSNKNIFYNSDGSMKSLNQIYKNFESKINQITPDHGGSSNLGNAAQDSYRPDPRFSSFYNPEIKQMMSAIPQLAMDQNTSFLTQILSDIDPTRMQNQVMDSAQFLRLMISDIPRYS